MNRDDDVNFDINLFVNNFFNFHLEWIYIFGKEGCTVII